jgi:YVTN family beta-propeller protein
LPRGSVYVEANQRSPGKNAVLQYRYCNGSLLQTVVGRYATGGSGAADLNDNGILDADQQIVISASQTLLFAVNQGSDSIAAFHIAADGSLTPVAGSPFPSGGPAPASVGVSGNILVVANKASDGVRNLGNAVPNYTTFTIEADGALTHTGTTYSLPRYSSPTQVYVAPGGNLVFGTEESGVLRGLQLSPTGGLTLAPGSPVSLPNSIFDAGQRPQPVWPAGLSATPTGSVLYTGVPNYGSIAAFAFTATGDLTFLSGEIAPEASLPCWSVVSPDGRRLYFANAGSNNVSVWDVATDPRRPAWLQTLTLSGGGNPWGLRIDPTGTLLFVISPRQVKQVPLDEGQWLHGATINADGTLAEMRGSPVPIPVAIDTNPFGVAVVADR